MKTCPNHCAVPDQPPTDFCLACGSPLTASTSGSLWQKQIDELNAWTGADEHLQFIKGLLKRVEIAAEACDDIFKQVARIEGRLNDPNLYLAVVGEFSSGKTTFINALLRDELLKTQSLITTAAATKLKCGEFLSVDVHLQDYPDSYLKASEQTGQITVVEKSPKKKSVWDWIISPVKWLWHQIQPPAVEPGSLTALLLTWFTTLEMGVKPFIHAVTAQNQIAEQLTDVIISHPAAFLADGIVIIDTPGTNPSTANDTNLHHRAITQRVVEKDADAAIIIVPASQPLTQTWRQFLAQHLQPYLHRCIFVVTRMDEIRRTREQQQLLEYVRQALINDFGIESPMVYASAAQVVIDDLSDEEEVRERLLVWVDRFVELEEVILKRLRQERVLSIAENVLRLLTQLFLELDGHLQAQWQEYESRQAAIEAEIIPDIPSFAAEQREICHQALQETILTVRSKMKLNIEKHLADTISSIKDLVFEADSNRKLKKVINKKVGQILLQEKKTIENNLKKMEKYISQTSKKVGGDFDQKFAEAYQRLEALKGQVTVDHRSAGRLYVKSSSGFSSTRSLNKKQDYKDLGVRAGGAGTGALLGSLILPGIGTVVGGVIGGLLAHLFVSLDERKKKIWEELEPELIKYFDEIKRQVEQNISAYVEHVEAALDKRIDHYVRQYQATVERMLNEQEAKRKNLIERQQGIQTDLRELERRQQLVSAQKKQLAVLQIDII